MCYIVNVSSPSGKVFPTKNIELKLQMLQNIDLKNHSSKVLKQNHFEDTVDETG